MWGAATKLGLYSSSSLPQSQTRWIGRTALSTPSRRRRPPFSPRPPSRRCCVSRISSRGSSPPPTRGRHGGKLQRARTSEHVMAAGRWVASAVVIGRRELMWWTQVKSKCDGTEGVVCTRCAAIPGAACVYATYSKRGRKNGPMRYARRRPHLELDGRLTTRCCIQPGVAPPGIATRTRGGSLAPRTDPIVPCAPAGSAAVARPIAPRRPRTIRYALRVRRPLDAPRDPCCVLHVE